MTDFFSQLSQYAQIGNELSAVLAAVGVPASHTTATLAHVTAAVSDVSTVGSVLSEAHTQGGAQLLSYVLLALQAFAPHILPGIQITAVAVTPPGSVLDVPQQ